MAVAYVTQSRCLVAVRVGHCWSVRVLRSVTFGPADAPSRRAPRRAPPRALLNQLFRGGRAVRRGTEIDRAPNTGHGAGRARLEGGAVGASASAVSDYTHANCRLTLAPCR